MNNLSGQTYKKLLIVIIALAGVLRLLGIWHGYPYSYYPDEANFVKRALSFGSFDFNPHWFHKPAFYMYILFFEYGLYFLIGKIVGLWDTVSDFAVSFIKNPGSFYLIGRVMTAVFSLGTIWVVYRVGERHFKKGTGIVGGLLLTFSYGHVAASQNIKADTPAVFFVALSMYFLLNYYASKRNNNLIWAVVFAGIGQATKSYALVMLIPILLSIILVHAKAEENASIRQIVRVTFLIALVPSVFYLSYFVCAPYNFIDPLGREETFSPFFEIAAKVSSFFGREIVAGPGDFIGQRAGYFGGAVNYIRVLIGTTGMGITIAGIGILGFVYLFSRLNKKAFLFLLYPIVFVALSIFIYPGYAESRHQLPIYPFLAISGGALIAELTESKGLRSSIVYIVLLICLFYPGYVILERAMYVSREDTRNIAKSWIEANITPGTKILVDENGPQLLMDKEQIQRLLQKAEKADPKGQFTAHYDTYLNYQLLAAKDSITYDLHEIRFPWWRQSNNTEGVHELSSGYDRDMGNPLRLVGVESYDYHLRNGFEYAIVHSNKYGQFLKDTNDSRTFPSFARFYRELFDRAILVKEFLPQPDHRPGPTVKVFKFRP